MPRAWTSSVNDYDSAGNYLTFSALDIGDMPMREEGAQGLWTVPEDVVAAVRAQGGGGVTARQPGPRQLALDFAVHPDARLAARAEAAGWDPTWWLDVYGGFLPFGGAWRLDAWAALDAQGGTDGR